MITGLLNNRITIKKKVDGVDTFNSPVPTYEDYLTTWANVYVRSANVNSNLQGLLFTTEFTIRYNSKTKLIDNTYQVVYGNSKYSIIEIIETEPKQAVKIIAQHYGN